MTQKTETVSVSQSHDHACIIVPPAVDIQDLVFSVCYIQISVETGSGHPGHPGHPGHIFSGSSGSDPVYNLSGSDPDWIT